MSAMAQLDQPSDQRSGLEPPPSRALGIKIWAGLRHFGAWLGGIPNALMRPLGSAFKTSFIREAPCGVIGIMLWLVLYTAGLSVNSTAFTDALTTTLATLQQSDVSAWGRFLFLLWGLVLLLMVLFTYTASNVAILCLLAGLIGVFASRMHNAAQQGAAVPEVMPARYLGALSGAFLIYLVVMSGSFTILGLPFQTPPMGDPKTGQAQFQYKTLATVASIVCFADGFQPFAIPIVNRWLRGKANADGPQPQSTSPPAPSRAQDLCRYAPQPAESATDAPTT